MVKVLERPRPPVTRRVNGHTPPPPPPTGGGDGPDREPSPRRSGLDNLRLAMLFFIGAESMFFAALISALFVLRVGQPFWPPPFQPRLPVAVTAVNTLVLLASSLTMAGATRALAAGLHRTLVERLGATAALGTLFLLIQGYEWIRLIEFGLTLTSGSYGVTFYSLIGFHALHVLAALVWLLATVRLAARGRFRDGPGIPVKACAMYWHFVVGLWPILYVAVYLL